MTLPSRELTDREQARFGPRALKTTGSLEWCWQTLDYFKTSLHHVDEQWRDAEEILQQLVETQAWKLIPPEHPYGTLTKMLKAEIGISYREIQKRIQDAKLLKKTERERNEAGRFQSDNITLERGTSESYARRRLKRDHPDLFTQAEARQLSWNKAAQEAGFRRRTTTVRIDDPRRAVAVLLKHFTREELLAALDD